MTYNPFEKPIGAKLEKDDLTQLIDNRVTEGYLVEFKAEFPENRKIAHSIAALANTNGGWYIVGVTTDENHVAKSIVGYDTSTTKDGVDKIREVVKSWIQPVPILYPQSITLDNGRGVLAIFVPEEQDVPFMTKDGHIYRRVADSSDPIKPVDRHALDRLLERGREARDRFIGFCNDERDSSEAESHHPWLNIYIAPYPGGINRGDAVGRSIEDLRLRIENSRKNRSLLSPYLAKEKEILGNIPFTSAYPSHDSVVLKQVNNGVANRALTLQLFVNGWAKLHMPLIEVRLTPVNYPEVKSDLCRELLGKLYGSDRSAALIKYFDVSATVWAISALTDYYLEWLGDRPAGTTFRFAAELQGTWRSVPFVDADKWGEHVTAFGMPVIGGDIEIGLSRSAPYFASDAVPLWLDIVSEVLLASGLTHDLLPMVLGSVGALTLHGSPRPEGTPQEE